MKKVLLMIIIPLVVLLFFSFYQKRDLYLAGCSGKSSQLNAFLPHNNEYLNVSLKTLNEAPYIDGKIITVDKNKSKIDTLFLMLPEYLRAITPDDIGTIVWLEWGEENVGTYNNGSKAYQSYCKVTVINKIRAGAFESIFFYGSAPPKTTSSGGNWHGEKPKNTEILKYLQSLPHKK